MGRLLSLMLFVVVSAATAQTQGSTTGDAARGKRFYNDKYMCYTCHGYSGQNGPGARLVPMKMSEAAFVAYVRNPSQPNRMPSFSAKVMPDSELADVYAYIVTLPNSAPDPKSVPLLNDLMKKQQQP